MTKKIFNFRMSTKEKDMLKRQAQKKGLSLSAYLKMLIYEKEGVKTA